MSGLYSHVDNHTRYEGEESRSAFEAELLARIAELETTIVGLKTDCDDYCKAWEQAEAELAALKGRRCETCELGAWLTGKDAEGIHYGCEMREASMDPNDFSCSKWAERGTE